MSLVGRAICLPHTTLWLAVGWGGPHWRARRPGDGGPEGGAGGAPAAICGKTAFFIKDVMGPKGAVSIVAKKAAAAGQSDQIDSHTKTESLLVHHADLNEKQLFAKKDEWIDLKDESSHQELCNREQAYFLQAFREDLDLKEHLEDALNSLKIAFACDESVKSGKGVSL